MTCTPTAATVPERCGPAPGGQRQRDPDAGDPRLAAACSPSPGHPRPNGRRSSTAAVFLDVTVVERPPPPDVRSFPADAGEALRRCHGTLSTGGPMRRPDGRRQWSRATGCVVSRSRRISIMTALTRHRAVVLQRDVAAGEQHVRAPARSRRTPRAPRRPTRRRVVGVGAEADLRRSGPPRSYGSRSRGYEWTSTMTPGRPRPALVDQVGHRLRVGPDHCSTNESSASRRGCPSLVRV